LWSPLLLAPASSLFPYTTLFRSEAVQDVIDDLLLVHAVEVVAFRAGVGEDFHAEVLLHLRSRAGAEDWHGRFHWCDFVEEASVRSEEHTSELQSRFDLVCRLLLE